MVGAGPAGLCAAKYMLKAGFEVTLYEAGSAVGGLWFYENDSGMSSAYKTLHINTDKYITQFEDFPLPPTASAFPHHTEMRAYLQSYADTFGLTERTQFNTLVTNVEPVVEDGGRVRWRIHDAQGGTREYDIAIVANGHLSKPRTPEFAKDFTGEYLHSHYYRDPADFVDKRICIVGAGNSACDIAADVCVTAERTVMAVRSGVVIVPKLVLGVPITRITTKLMRMHAPPAVIQRVTKLITRVVHGDMQRWGFKKPDRATHPTSHATLINHIAYRRVAVKPGIKKIVGRLIEFEDGTAEEFDTLIAATGYTVDLPMLSERVLPVNDEWAQLYKRVVPVDWPGLYVIGLIQYVGPLFKSFEAQSKWVVEIESGRYLLPERQVMRDANAAKQEQNRRQFHGSPRHALEEPALPYQKDLKREVAAGRLRWQRAAKGGAVPRELALARCVEPRPGSAVGVPEESSVR
ncbi:NAD(P)-binding domain-containing protein [Micromonospora sp. NPDC005305]|uniref:flavin-containing monooxygenase n=1 Tax=Micromonospora sp. NPDC005305 TaxID=3156875 RepID=UPI0033B47FD8